MAVFDVQFVKISVQEKQNFGIVIKTMLYFKIKRRKYENSNKQ